MLGVCNTQKAINSCPLLADYLIVRLQMAGMPYRPSSCLTAHCFAELAAVLSMVDDPSLPASSPSPHLSLTLTAGHSAWAVLVHSVWTGHQVVMLLVWCRCWTQHSHGRGGCPGGCWCLCQTSRAAPTSCRCVHVQGCQQCLLGVSDHVPELWDLAFQLKSARHTLTVGF